MSVYLAVNEIFGPTLQGEGKNIGMPCFFLRLSGCNQHCVWCDTPYTWDWTGRNGTRYDPALETHKMSTDAVLQRLFTLQQQAGGAIGNLVISGGEPFLQQDALRPLVFILQAHGWHVEIETAGSITPHSAELADLFTVSIKLANSGNDAKVRLNPEAIKFFSASGRSVFKFVVTSLDDFNEINELVETYELHPVYIMPEGITAQNLQQHAQAVTAAALVHGYYLTTRLQILTYGNQRAT